MLLVVVWLSGFVCAVSGVVVVWFRGGVVVWWCGCDGLVVCWLCVGCVVWLCSDVVVWWLCGGCVVVV